MSLTFLMVLVSWFAIVLMALGMAGLLRQVRDLTRRLEDPGALVPSGPRIVDELDSLTLQHDQSVVLFASANCKACGEVLPAFSRLHPRFPALNFVCMFDGAANGQVAETREHEYQLLTNMAPAFVRLSIPVTPFAVITNDRNLVVQAAPVGSVELLETFLTAAKEAIDEDAA